MLGSRTAVPLEALQLNFLSGDLDQSTLCNHLSYHPLEPLSSLFSAAIERLQFRHTRVLRHRLTPESVRLCGSPTRFGDVRQRLLALCSPLQALEPALGVALGSPPPEKHAYPNYDGAGRGHQRQEF